MYVAHIGRAAHLFFNNETLMTFTARLKINAETVQSALDAHLQPNVLSGPNTASERLVAAMRHGALNGGKRLRPFLVIETANLFNVNSPNSLNAALAVELVHCYSLVHDDLPAMDNDDLRRGKPTVHKAYDYATAILAGDGLLTHAFGLLAADGDHADADIGNKLVLELVAGSGAGGMAGGQMRDLEGEKQPFSHDDIALMQRMKTGALIRASVRMGAILGQAKPDQLAALTTYAEHAGRAFQLADDILDVTATTDQLGKAAGKDADRQKPTLIAKIGIEAARRHLGETIHNAISALTMFGPEADILRQTARYFAERES